MSGILEPTYPKTIKGKEMTKLELQAAIGEHNRIIDMLVFEEEYDMACAITSSFFEAYADNLSSFPEVEVLIITSGLTHE